MVTRQVILTILSLLLFPLLTTAQNESFVLTVTDSEPYVGELFTYTITYKSTDDLSEAQLQLPDFIGFAQQPAPPSLSIQTENGLPINVLEQTVILYATRVEQFTIEPAIITLAETPFQSGRIVTSDPISINVRALPLNAPDTFSGAVGQFDINNTIELPTIQAGELNILSITLTGAGNFDQILSPSHNLPVAWQVFPRTPITAQLNQSVQSKIFQYQFFPDQTGVISIPSIAFSFFDPITETYKTLTTQEIQFNVEGEFTAQNQTTSPATNPSLLPLKSMQDQPANIVPAISFWGMWLIAPIIVILLAFFQFVTHPRTQSAQVRLKQSPALTSAIQILTQARQSTPNQIYEAVEQSIMLYFSETYQENIISTNQLMGFIDDLPSTLQQNIKHCLQQAQSGRYAPVTADDAKKLLKRTYKTLQLIEKERK